MGERAERAGRSSAALTWARRVLGLYPRAWRARYAEEVLAVLQQHRVTGWTVLDVLVGAADAHLRRDLLPGRLTSMAHRIRTSAITIFCAFVVFGIAWLAVQYVRDPVPQWERVTQLHPEIRAALIVVQGTGVVALLAILAGGLPILWLALQQAIRARRRTVLLLLAVPILAAAVFAVYAILALAPSTAGAPHPTPSAPFTPLALALQFGFAALFFLAIGGSTAAVALAVARSEPSERALRFALAPAAVATLAIAVGLVATVGLGALAQVEAPEVFPLGQLVIVALLMLGATALAGVALRRGLAAARTGVA
jgi:hypothetical protein